MGILINVLLHFSLTKQSCPQKRARKSLQIIAKKSRTSRCRYACRWRDRFIREKSVRERERERECVLRRNEKPRGEERERERGREREITVQYIEN